MNQFLNAQHTWVALDSEALAAALLEAVDARDLPGMADLREHVLGPVRENCQRTLDLIRADMG